MRYKIVSVRDRAVDTFSVPQFVAAIGAAVRAFGDEIKRKADNNALSMHPEDYDLYDLGEYDDDTGQFHGQVPKCIAVGKDYAG